MSDTLSVDQLRDDAEARLDFLIEADVIDVDDDGSVTSTADFEDTRGIYADTYKNSSDEQFAETIADVFETSVAEAETRIEETDLTRQDLITYLSLQSHLDRDLPQDVLVLLTTMVTGVGYGSAVPDSMDELDDDTYAEYVETHGDTVIIVWSYPCDPCRSLKEDLSELRDRLHESVTIAGVDGDSVGQFRSEFDVSSAPTMVLFADGEAADTIEGYLPVEVVTDRFAEVYEDASAGPDED